MKKEKLFYTVSFAAIFRYDTDYAILMLDILLIDHINDHINI